jgi:hypothetical protein
MLKLSTNPHVLMKNLLGFILNTGTANVSLMQKLMQHMILIMGRKSSSMMTMSSLHCNIAIPQQAGNNSACLYVL